MVEVTFTCQLSEVYGSGDDDNWRSGRLLDHRVLLGIPIPSSQQQGLTDQPAMLKMTARKG